MAADRGLALRDFGSRRQENIATGQVEKTAQNEKWNQCGQIGVRIGRGNSR
jgi:hypothetical protein